jgi:hypothetical protein
MEQITIQFFKSSRGDEGREVDSFIKRVSLTTCLGARGEGTLSLFTSSTETLDISLVLTDVFLHMHLNLELA